MEDIDKSASFILHAFNLDFIHTCKCNYPYLLQTVYTRFPELGLLNMTENNDVNSYIQAHYSISCYVQCSYNKVHLLDGDLCLT
jgi:hypothetical protein